MPISTEHSAAAGVSEQAISPKRPVRGDPLQPEHGHEWPPAAPPPANLREWEAGYRSFASDPHKKTAIEKFLSSLTPSQRRRIDRQLRSNQSHADKPQTHNQASAAGCHWDFRRRVSTSPHERGRDVGPRR